MADNCPSNRKDYDGVDLRSVVSGGNFKTPLTWPDNIWAEPPIHPPKYVDANTNKISESTWQLAMVHDCTLELPVP